MWTRNQPKFSNGKTQINSLSVGVLLRLYSQMAYLGFTLRILLRFNLPEGFEG